MADRLRLFTAIEIPETLRKRLDSQARDWSTLLGAGRWVARENIHVTLLFLGAVGANDLADITGRLNRVARELTPWRSVVKGLGAFPDAHRARVLWAGVEGGEERFAELYARLQEEIGSFCERASGKRFTPHVTLARFKARPPELLGDLIEEQAGRVWGEMEVESVVLFESRLSTQGPTYSIIHSAALRG